MEHTVMHVEMINKRRRARRRRNAILSNCRFWFPAEGIDIADLHNPEVSTDLRDNDPRAYDTIVGRGIDGYRLH